MYRVAQKSKLLTQYNSLLFEPPCNLLVLLYGCTTCRNHGEIQGQYSLFMFNLCFLRLPALFGYCRSWQPAIFLSLFTCVTVLLTLIKWWIDWLIDRWDKNNTCKGDTSKTQRQRRDQRRKKSASSQLIDPGLCHYSLIFVHAVE